MNQEIERARADYTREKKAEKLRAEADDLDRSARESFDRCDTDGFLSQWASGICADEKRLAAIVEENGGRSTFPGLFLRETGERVRAKIIETKFGRSWAFCDADDKFTGFFVPVNHKNSPRSKLYKHGFETRDELAPARACIDGKGYGLSGSAWATVKRIDGGYPPDAKVIGD